MHAKNKKYLKEVLRWPDIGRYRYRYSTRATYNFTRTKWGGKIDPSTHNCRRGFPNSGSVSYQEDDVHHLNFNRGNEMIFINEIIEIFSELSVEQFVIASNGKFPKYNHDLFLKIMNSCKIDVKKIIKNFHEAKNAISLGACNCL